MKYIVTFIMLLLTTNVHAQPSWKVLHNNVFKYNVLIPNYLKLEKTASLDQVFLTSDHLNIGVDSFWITPSDDPEKQLMRYMDTMEVDGNVEDIKPDYDPNCFVLLGTTFTDEQLIEKVCVINDVATHLRVVYDNEIPLADIYRIIDTFTGTRELIIRPIKRRITILSPTKK